MMLTWMLIFMSLCSILKSRDLDCTPDPYVDNHDVKCFRTETSCSNDTLTTLKVAWNYVNLEAGSVNISILGNTCLPSNYTLHLYRYDNFEDDSCDEFKKELLLNKCLEGNNCNQQGTKKHSYRKINQSVGIPCEQVQNVTFEFIYSGIYIFAIQKDRKIEFYSDPVCFNTNFKKESVYNQTIDIFSKYVPDWNSMIHTIHNFSRLHVNRLTIEVWQNKSENADCIEMRIAQLFINFKSHGVECNYKPKTKHKCRLKLEEGNDRIECSIENVTAGNHCLSYLQVFLNHDPCRDNEVTVWGNEVICRMKGKTAKAVPVYKIEEGISSTGPVDTRVVVVILILCLVFVVAIAILVKFLYNRWRNTGVPPGLKDPPNPMEDIPLPVVQPQVFLTYARDCPAFMETMVIVRNLLKAINCKVYDCFDMDFSEEIAQIGSSWPGKYICNENVKVLLFETKCAKLQYAAHIKNFKIAYQEPTCLDDYFICSLKSLIHHPENTSYDKVFVACVSGFTTEEDKLAEITPFTRYDIPDAINNLITSLCQPHSTTFPENWSSNVLKLEEAVKKLEKYRTSNEDYLQKFLIKTEITKFRRFISKFTSMKIGK